MMSPEQSAMLVTGIVTAALIGGGIYCACCATSSHSSAAAHYSAEKEKMKKVKQVAEKAAASKQKVTTALPTSALFADQSPQADIDKYVVDSNFASSTTWMTSSNRNASQDLRGGVCQPPNKGTALPSTGVSSIMLDAYKNAYDTEAIASNVSCQI